MSLTYAIYHKPPVVYDKMSSSFICAASRIVYQRVIPQTDIYSAFVMYVTAVQSTMDHLNTILQRGRPVVYQGLMFVCREPGGTANINQLII